MFNIFDLTTWPENLQEYGEESLVKLFDHFQPLLIVTVAEMKANFMDYKVFACHRERYWIQDILCLILHNHIFRELPVNTAVLEHGSSTMNCIKSDWRSLRATLKVNTLTTSGPAVDRWYSLGP